MLCTKFVKFVLVGAFNTAFAYGVYAFFLYTGMEYVLAASLAQVVSILFNFKTFGTLVFRARDNSAFFRFLGSYVMIYLVAIGFLRVFDGYGVNMYIAGLLITPLMAALSFILQNRFVFRKTGAQS